MGYGRRRPGRLRRNCHPRRMLSGSAALTTIAAFALVLSEAPSMVVASALEVPHRGIQGEGLRLELESLRPGQEKEIDVVSDDIDTDTDTDTDIDSDKEDGDQTEEGERSDSPDPHAIVLMWLNNRAEFAETNWYRRPWRLHRNDNAREAEIVEKYEELKFQNGFYFASRFIRLESPFSVTNNANANANANATELEPSNVTRLVAHQTIPKGSILVSVPSNTFVYKRRHPFYKQLHPCDVVAKLLDATTYLFPDDDELEDVPRPSLEKFVRPFIESIYEMPREDEDDTRWTPYQLAVLTKILGNELGPKPNTLGPYSKNQTQPACQHPDNDYNKEVYMDTINEEYIDEELVRSTLRTVISREWDNRMVPVYHWIPRATPGDPSINLVHSELYLTNDERNMKKTIREKREGQREKIGEVLVTPRAYQLRASRTIQAGETLVLPFASVAQEFASTGRIARAAGRDEGVPHRFWAQTMHDHEGRDVIYFKTTNDNDPFEEFLVWDYYPESKTIRWVHKVWGAGETNGGVDANSKTAETLRPTQRAVLKAQYDRLRSLEPDIRALLSDYDDVDDDDDDDDAHATNGSPDPYSNAAIYDYYQLWMESLGVLLAHSRPSRTASTTTLATTASHGKCSETESTCHAHRGTNSTYDDLRKRPVDPVDYNNAIASHECTNLFEQYTYETSKTIYADLEWTRSYIGGGSIEDDEEEGPNGYREQDTCLHINNVLHSCLAFRPHVHETLIHYPASFLPKGGLKRVLYVGGGDLVLLHELLRYESAELIIGMELDQMVLRGSFRHYGIQPKFEDERVHWWFGDAAKSLSLLPPEDFFGTFDLVLIDLVVEIFDGLRVGDQNERLVDYMAKLLKPEGILVRQEDYPHHNVVDFAKYTVDLNVFGMPHTCSQYFTMASNAVNFVTHERVDHELEGLVWYEPNIESNDHLLMWGDYRNNLVPPERICDATPKNTTLEPIPVLPTKGIFIAIEAENVTLPLGNASLVHTSVKMALEELGFTRMEFYDFSPPGSPSFSANSTMFSFEQGYLMLRSYPETNYCSMDLQLWNDISNHKPAVSKLVEAVGGSTANDSTSSFLVTTGGMFGFSNVRPPQEAIVPSSWCQDDSSVEHESSEPSYQKALMGLETVMRNMLARFMGTTDSIVLVLCSNEESRCSLRDDVKYGAAQVIAFDACPEIVGGNDSSLSYCEKQLSQTIQHALSSRNNTGKIDAIVIDPQAPLELGQITKKLFVTDSSSYEWLSHDLVLLAPSVVDGKLEEFSSSWRYQLLERFRTDLIEFNPVYHATTAVRDPSLLGTWTMGVLCVGNPLFYDQLVASLHDIREEGDHPWEVILIETKTGAVSRIPDYQPSKWATPSDYDIKPAKQQWSDQRPVGGQVLVQHERVPSEFPKEKANIQKGSKVIFNRIEQNDWVVGDVLDIINEEYIIAEGDGYQHTAKLKHMIPYDVEAILASDDVIPFGSIVMADDNEEQDGDLQFFYEAQIIDQLDDGRYKVYYLTDGVAALLNREQVVRKPTRSFSSPAEAKLFSSCAEFHDLLFGSDEKPFEYCVFPREENPNRKIFRREVGDGCLVTVSWGGGNGNKPNTIIASYDGQIHVAFNAFEPEGDSDGSGEFLKSLSSLRIPGMKSIQNDSHPRGYGRVVNFKEDLEKNYFGTQFPIARDY